MNWNEMFLLLNWFISHVLQWHEYEIIEFILFT
jgi:hypothetical protein